MFHPDKRAFFDFDAWPYSPLKRGFRVHRNGLVCEVGSIQAPKKGHDPHFRAPNLDTSMGKVADGDHKFEGALPRYRKKGASFLLISPERRYHELLLFFVFFL